MTTSLPYSLKGIPLSLAARRISFIATKSVAPSETKEPPKMKRAQRKFSIGSGFIMPYNHTDDRDRPFVLIYECRTPKSADLWYPPMNAQLRQTCYANPNKANRPL
uniref:Uncharacterized protein n=1 Tax=Glossina austeni TaxID=7395 RepID=A0A1A9V3D5_GLOAU